MKVMELDLCIKGGNVVSPTGITEMDVGVWREKIILLGEAEYFPKARRTIDAKGKYVIPGGIDTHSHLEVSFQGAFTGDDFYSGTVAAAFGGTTCIIDFARCMKGESPVEILQKRMEQARPKAVVDYAFHITLTEASSRVLSEIKEVVQIGCPSFKLFMIYRKEGQMIDDGGLLAVFEEAAKWNAIPGVHAENAAITEYNVEKAVSENKLDWIRHAFTKPNIVEIEAIQRAILLSKCVGIPLNIFHLSTGEGADLILQAQKDGRPVYAETTPHYLTLTEEVYKREDGHYYLCSPPLRKKKDVDRLWEGLRVGCPTFTGTDHASFTPEDKEKFLERREGKLIPNFTKVANGVPGIEVRLPILLNGVREGKLSMNRLVTIFSTNAARIFGLYPRKGVIAVGSDADLVIVDLKKERVLSAKTLHMHADFCPYEGMKVMGYPILTVSRGKILTEDDRFFGSPGCGSFIKRKIDPLVLKDASWL